MVFTTRATHDDELEVATRYRDYARSKLREKKSELEEAKELVEKIQMSVVEAEREYKQSKSFLKKAEKKHERRSQLMMMEELRGQRDEAEDDEEEEEEEVSDDDDDEDYYDRKPSTAGSSSRRRTADEAGFSNMHDESSGYVYDSPPPSQRIRRMYDNYGDADDDDEEDDGYGSENQHHRRPAAVTPIWSPRSSQNEQQKQSHHRHENEDNDNDDDDWMADMHYFLETVPHGRSNKVSNTNNARTVMMRVKQLASGDGVGYSHWPKTKIFAKNEPIDLMTSNFDELLERAKRWENKYGRDRGNGWLLKHPLTKLKIYQDYRKNPKKYKRKLSKKKKT